MKKFISRVCPGDEKTFKWSLCKRQIYSLYVFTAADHAIHNKIPWTLSLSKSSVPDTLSLVAFSSSTESVFTQLGMNHMLLAIYHPCLKFFCSYRHTVKFSGQIKSVREKHKSILQTANGTISLIKTHLQ